MRHSIVSYLRYLVCPTSTISEPSVLFAIPLPMSLCVIFFHLSVFLSLSSSLISLSLLGPVCHRLFISFQRFRVFFVPSHCLLVRLLIYLFAYLHDHLHCVTTRNLQYYCTDTVLYCTVLCLVSFTVQHSAQYGSVQCSAMQSSICTCTVVLYISPLPLILSPQFFFTPLKYRICFAIFPPSFSAAILTAQSLFFRQLSRLLTLLPTPLLISIFLLLLFVPSVSHARFLYLATMCFPNFF